MNMPIPALLIAAILGIATVGGAVAAAESHDSHASHGAGHSELTLDHGRPWPTDGALRHGMTEIRTLMADALPQIHAGRFATTDYTRLAGGISDRIEHLAANCQLPPDADAQLHLVLARIIDGTERMKDARKAQDGAVAIIGAMDSYGRYFSHPGWQPLSH